MSVPYRESMNKGRFETWTSQPEIEYLHCTQVHGTDLARPEQLPCEADGLVLTWEKFDKPLAIKTADCLPVVIEGESGVVFLHAGWRGLAFSILQKKEIQEITPQRVLIGPCIHECCFEVSEDFKANFPNNPNFREREGKLYFDLPQEALRQLHELFPNLLVEIAPICTCCDTTFHSYRRDKTNLRNWNLYIKG